MLIIDNIQGYIDELDDKFLKKERDNTNPYSRYRPSRFASFKHPKELIQVVDAFAEHLRKGLNRNSFYFKCSYQTLEKYLLCDEFWSMQEDKVLRHGMFVKILEAYYVGKKELEELLLTSAKAPAKEFNITSIIFIMKNKFVEWNDTYNYNAHVKQTTELDDNSVNDIVSRLNKQGIKLINETNETK